jgi:hypothetical protein
VCPVCCLDREEKNSVIFPKTIPVVFLPKPLQKNYDGDGEMTCPISVGIPYVHLLYPTVACSESTTLHFTLHFSKKERFPIDEKTSFFLFVRLQILDVPRTQLSTVHGFQNVHQVRLLFNNYTLNKAGCELSREELCCVR